MKKLLTKFTEKMENTANRRGFFIRTKTDTVLNVEKSSGSSDKNYISLGSKSPSTLKHSSCVLQPLKLRSSIKIEQYAQFFSNKGLDNLKCNLEPIKTNHDLSDEDSIVSELVAVLSTPSLTIKQRKTKEIEKIYIPDRKNSLKSQGIFHKNTKFVPPINQKHIPRVSKSSRKLKRETYLDNVKYTREFYLDINNS